MELLDLIYPQYKIVSLIGMAKNAGKTMTLNHIIESSIERGVIIGLTSTGRDGEKEDIVTKTEKPTIYVERGTIIATAKELLLKCEAKIEILEVTHYSTSLGEVVIGKVRSSGLVELAGPDINLYMKDIANKMLNYGAEIVLIDGAIDRKSVASPWIADGVILSTGAVINRNVEVVKNETHHQLELFNLDTVKNEDVRKICEEFFSRKDYAIVDKEGNIEQIPIKTALNSGTFIGSAIKEDTKYVIISGSLVEKALRDIIEVCPYYKNVTFIVNDSTRIFIDRKAWRIFKAKGINVNVLHSIKVLAVTVNPYAPQGYYFTPKEFLWYMRRELPSIPVVDVEQEE